MAATKELAATVRSGTGKGAARSVRREGRIPGVIYGGGEPPQPIALEYRTLNKLIYAGHFLTTIFEIDVAGAKERVIPRDYQLDPVKDQPLHVDFLRLKAGSTLRVEVPVRFLNQETAPGIKRGGSELGTRLNAIIRTGVQPAPRVSIGVVQLPGDGGPRDLAVIRVEEGDWPPYVYWATKNEQKIVVRSNDESLPPKLLELDALYERRARTSKASERRMPLGLPGLKSPFGRLVIETGRPTAVLFHRGTDDTLQDAAFRFLRGDKGLEVFQRTAHSFGFHTTGSLGEVRALWMHASGCVMFATRTTPEGFDGPGTISITDLADDLIAGCRIANSVLHDAFEWHGEIKVDLHLDAGDSQIHNGGNRTWSNFGLMLQPESLNRRPGIAQSETVTMRADVSELLNPTGLLAQMLVGVLRTITFANIDVDRFSKSLDELVANAAELQE